MSALRWHRLTKSYRLQVHHSITHHLYTTVCVHPPIKPPSVTLYPPTPSSTHIFLIWVFISPVSKYFYILLLKYPRVFPSTILYLLVDLKHVIGNRGLKFLTITACYAFLQKSLTLSSLFVKGTLGPVASLTMSYRVWSMRIGNHIQIRHITVSLGDVLLEIRLFM